MGIFAKPKDILPFYIARAAIAYAIPFELFLNIGTATELYIDSRVIRQK
jgi:hypothetical protein